MSHHLTALERETISQMIFAGSKQAEIATKLGRHPGTISRELNRNSVKGAYSAVAAQQLYQQRRADRPFQKKMDDPATQNFVRLGLVQYWSPEQISGRIPRQPDKSVRSVSRQSIYRWIRNDEDRHYWEGFLRRRGKRRRPANDRRGQLPGTVSISGRPELANNRSRLGDWEGDTIVSPRKRDGLLTMTDRKSGYLKLGRLKNLKAQTTRESMASIVRGLPADRRHTMTLDQGKEFAGLVNGKNLFAEGVFFAHPGCPWERGSNENTNGLIRQIIPKGTEIGQLPANLIRNTEKLFNNRPRKRLNYRTPHEVFFENSNTSRCA
jgi:IS30 family transposase